VIYWGEAAADARGIRPIASDIGWTVGRGERVAGSGQALLFAMTGRATAVPDDLTGPGVERLRQRS